ncbi:hypothetical protein [Pedobacter sp. Hv1]|uniref:hypothetical protein n=1 Tax=Pedobacter sp. Hv1 TaxID=1740090 RepID=UPI000B30084C|nr:hypothetical protein [Pedobacter sp. Hv1]
MMKLQHLLAIVMAGMALPCCKSMQTVNEIPAAIYTVSPKKKSTIDSGTKDFQAPAHFKADVEETDGILQIKPLTEQLLPIELTMNPVQNLHIYRYTFDIDILTMPVKVRPAVKSFPAQLNADFSAAIYFGYRKDSYNIQSGTTGNSKFKINGAGYGYGAFIGIGSVTMNPFVTNQHIDYEYNGFVLNGGFAGIYDAKKFNLGLAIGIDHLADKNRKSWIYQDQIWFGLLFGINLN